MSDNKALTKYLDLIDGEQELIRTFFQQPESKEVYINYETFRDNFRVDESNFKEENLNIIDIHLRYRWWIREQMAVYKWTPIFLMTPALMRSWFLLFMVPYAYSRLFDHYFQSYFLWKHRKDRIINIREEFATKLSKPKNKLRRMELFQKIYPRLKLEQKEELPYKYIKFGEFTQYLFHAEVDGQEQSSIMQTTLFQNYLAVKDIFWTLSKPSNIWKSIVQFKNDFAEFRKDPERHRYKINVQEVLDQPMLIKEDQVYTLEDNIDHNVRRWSELFAFIWKGSLQPSQFQLWQYTNFSEYKDIYQALRYNYKNNNSDLAVYFSIVSIPKLLNLLFRRR